MGRRTPHVERDTRNSSEKRKLNRLAAIDPRTAFLRAQRTVFAECHPQTDSSPIAPPLTRPPARSRFRDANERGRFLFASGHDTIDLRTMLPPAEASANAFDRNPRFP